MAVTVLTTKGYIFGHPVTWDEERQMMRYDDNGELASPEERVRRKCPKCNLHPDPDGYDPCLGHIEGVYAACCGHGVENGFIAWEPY